MLKKTLLELKKEKPSHIQYTCRMLVKAATEKISRVNKPFLNITFADKSDSFIFNCFDDHPYYTFFQSLPEGSVVDATVSVDRFNDQFSLRLIFAQSVDITNPSVLEEVLESPSESIDDLWTKMNSILDTISDTKLKSLVSFITLTYSEQLKTYPAARSIHHAYRGGLLEHTTHMLEIAKNIISIYPNINEDLVLTGILLHDLGKIKEYTNSIVLGTTIEGQLKGHTLLGIEILRDAAKIVPIDPKHLLALEHIIGSHMNKLEWGAVAIPSTPEAILVSQIDALDAKVQTAVYHAPKVIDNHFTGYVKGLDTRLVQI